MKDGIILWLFLLTSGITSAWAQPYEGRTLPPAQLPNIQELIERKHAEVVAEETMPLDRLGLELALAHKYCRDHVKVCDTIKGAHFHDYTIWDCDRLSDEIIARYGKDANNGQ